MRLLTLLFLLAFCRTSEAQQSTEIDLSGTVVAAPCSLVPSTSSLAFGQVKTGEIDAKTVYLRNEGGLSCVIDSVEVTGDAAFRIELPNAPRPFVVLPGAQFAIHVHFHPEALGEKTATIVAIWRPE